MFLETLGHSTLPCGLFCFPCLRKLGSIHTSCLVVFKLGRALFGCSCVGYFVVERNKWLEKEKKEKNVKKEKKRKRKEKKKEKKSVFE